MFYQSMERVHCSLQLCLGWSVNASETTEQAGQEGKMMFVVRLELDSGVAGKDGGQNQCHF